MSFAPSSSPSRRLEERSRDLDDRLENSTTAQVIVYDNVDKIAWMIPQSNIILYMFHLIVRLRRHSVLREDNEEAKAATAEVTSDSATAAPDAIYDSLELKIKKRDADVQVSKIAERLCARLDIVASSLLSVFSAARKGRSGSPKYLYGFEMLDIARNKSNPPIKQQKADQPWSHISEVYGVVLFCKGFGQAIVAEDSSLLCNKWSRVPLYKNYFVATSYSIRALFDRTEDETGSQLSDQVHWKVGEPLVQYHTPGTQKSSCYHTQSLVSIGRPIKEILLIKKMEEYMNGAFIFHKSLVRRSCRDTATDLANLEVRSPY